MEATHAFLALGDIERIAVYAPDAKVFGCSATDAMGDPFPILHMQLEKTS